MAKWVDDNSGFELREGPALKSRVGDLADGGDAVSDLGGSGN